MSLSFEIWISKFESRVKSPTANVLNFEGKPALLATERQNVFTTPQSAPFRSKANREGGGRRQSEGGEEEAKASPLELRDAGNA